MSEFGAEPRGPFTRLRNHRDPELGYRALSRAIVELCIQKGLFTQAEYRAALDRVATDVLATTKGGT